MATITEDYVSFEIAKLLKERGFTSENCHTAYDDNGNFFWYGDYSKDRKCVIDAPTLQMAMKWLREVHNINIEITSIWVVGFGYNYIARTIVEGESKKVLKHKILSSFHYSS